jgi:ribosomal protein S18 acetylase RimI-like enzyme
MAASEPWISLKRDLDGCRVTLRRPGTELFVARDQSDHDALGFILLAAYGFAASPYVACFAVSKDAQNRGIGSQLLAFAEDLYRERDHLFLLVSSFNHKAQQFYIRHGYKPVGDLQDYIVPGHSELIFHKQISSPHQ